MDGDWQPLNFPFADSPGEGDMIRVTDGLYWLRLPLPFALTHINLWALDDGDGWFLVDCGVASARTRALWERIFQGPLAGRPVSRVLATHFHPDHVGLADWIVQRFGGSLLMTRTEWLVARMLLHDLSPASQEAAIRFYQAAGVGQAELDALSGQALGYGRGVPSVTPTYTRLQDGTCLSIGGRSWQVVVGRGHSPEHACLWSAELGILIAGDQVLPSITPNISVWGDEPEADPLGEFLDSIERLRRLPADCLVLPSHGRPFRGLHARLDQMAAHHADRLRETREAAARAPLSAAELTRTMFRRDLDMLQLRFAVGEALAHLNRLVATGDLVRGSDAEGVMRFAPSRRLAG